MLAELQRLLAGEDSDQTALARAKKLTEELEAFAETGASGPSMIEDTRP